MNLGITGGEEDGVDNSDVDVSKLYTQPEEVAYAYEELSKVSDQFTIAAAFGNVHGVYKPGNVKLTPKILKNSQEHITEKYGVSENHIDFVFHGGSGSTVEEIREGIAYGVIKMNIDTDMQYAYMKEFAIIFENTEYLKAQIGNPDGADVPNKKYYDPRRWLREGEEAFINRLKKAFEDLNNVNTLIKFFRFDLILKFIIIWLGSKEKIKEFKLLQKRKKILQKDFGTNLQPVKLLKQMN